jgi:hypothetical protein
VKYLIMIYSNPQSRELWDRLPDDERLEFGRGHVAFGEELIASGELVHSEGLAGQELATRVTVRGGRTLTSDGPFPEVKEYLAGFYLVECASAERAVEIAARAPDALRGGEVEVRPVLDLAALGMVTA